MIKFIVFDFDGVFTDGSVIFDNDNNMIKKLIFGLLDVYYMNY